MATISCYECGARMNAGAHECPQCGTAGKNETDARRILVICLSILGVVGLCIGARS